MHIIEQVRVANDDVICCGGKTVVAGKNFIVKVLIYDNQAYINPKQ